MKKTPEQELDKSRAAMRELGKTGAAAAAEINASLLGTASPTITNDGLIDPELQTRLAESASDSRVIQAIMAEPWAITPAAMQRILTIAMREDLDPQAIDTAEPDALDRPLRYGYARADGVGVLQIRGPVFRYANLFTEMSGATSLELAARDLRALLDDESVRRLVIDVDSPGGQVNGTEELAEMVFGARGAKEIIAYASGDATSAAYWIASAADRVVTNRTSVLGSIGAVIGLFADKDENFVEFVSAQSPKKRLNPKTDAGRAEYQQLIDSLGQVFVETVARNRGVDVDTVLSDFGQGGVMAGDKAVAAGLADDVMSFDSLIAELTTGSDDTNQPEVFSMSEKPSPDAKSGNGGNGGDTREITAEVIASEHPEITEHFRKQGAESVDSDALRNEGATRERERIQAVQDQTIPGHEDLIDSLMFDGVTTGEQAAVKVLAAEKAKRGEALDKFKSGPEPQPAADSVPATKAPEKQSAPSDFSTEGLKAAWAKESADVRAEFDDDVDAYVCYWQATSENKVRVLGGER